ncbi:sugar transferase [Roseburia sp. AM16-25]|nr:sugar transferase [Roseburia sp. AM16-25]
MTEHSGSPIGDTTDPYVYCAAPVYGAVFCHRIGSGSDGGDVFYRQTRCTKDMRNFEIIKFRSMIMGAEEKSGPQIAGKKDERMTRVGYVLRKFKIDELPQLINIFRGDMSFVGPRPERPEIIAEIVEDVPEYTFRATVPAGLTGYAQVHGDYHTEFLDKLKWDLMYIENHSLMLDLKIILMTVPVVLRGSDDVWLIINANI